MNGWLDWCIRRPGSLAKTGYAGINSRLASQVEGEVKHSAEGHLEALLGELDRPSRQASWHFSVAKSGVVYQHYPIFGEGSVTWHCGLPGDRSFDTSFIGNITLVGEEYEGGGPNSPGEPLTESQYAASLRLSRDIRALCPHVGASPPALRRSLWEHNWLSSTSCPSGRIPWDRLVQDLTGGADMHTLVDHLKEPILGWVVEGETLTLEEALQYLRLEVPVHRKLEHLPGGVPKHPHGIKGTVTGETL